MACEVNRRSASAGRWQTYAPESSRGAGVALSSMGACAVAAACGIGAVALRAESQPVTASAAAVMAAMANEPIFFIFVGMLILIFVQS